MSTTISPPTRTSVRGDGRLQRLLLQTAIQHLTAGGVLTNLNGLLPSEERYSYQFDANLQGFDYILVTHGLANGAQDDSVHINAEFSAGTRPTDHDPQVALFSIPAPNQAPTDLVIDHQSVDENQAAGTLVGILSATDKATDTLTYSLTDDAGGRFTVDPTTGVVTTTGSFDHEANASSTSPPRLPSRAASRPSRPSPSPSATSTRLRRTSRSIMRRWTRTSRPAPWSAPLRRAIRTATR